jgi:hypothetical protein
MGEGTGGVDPRTLTTITISFQYNVSYLPRMHLWAISDICTHNSIKRELVMLCKAMGHVPRKYLSSCIIR